jgi:hypothetical protein
MPQAESILASTISAAAESTRGISANSTSPNRISAGGISAGGLDRGCVGTTCIYFVADRPPIVEPLLMLNGDGDGSVNHVFVMSNASHEVAPRDKALISVSLVGDTPYDPDSVRSQLRNWFGTQAADWSELAVYRIPQALPRQPPGFATVAPVHELQNVILCGDYCASASLDGALRSGRVAAERAAQRMTSE